MMRPSDDFSWPLGALPAIFTAGRFALEDRHFSTIYRSRSHALHVHDYHAVMRLGDRTIAVRPGDMTLPPGGEASAYDLPRPGHHWCVHFYPAAHSKPVAKLPLHLPLGSLGEHAGQRIMAIAQWHTIGTAVGSAAASAAMLELLLWLTMQASGRSGTSRVAPRGVAAAERAAALLHERLAEPVDIPTLADEVALTQNYLARIFRRRFGMTMPHFLLTSRINQAKHLLRHTTVPVWRVGQRVGISDVQHFNKQFRRLTGMSPSAYRHDGRATER